MKYIIYGYIVTTVIALTLASILYILYTVATKGITTWTAVMLVAFLAYSIVALLIGWRLKMHDRNKISRRRTIQ